MSEDPFAEWGEGWDRAEATGVIPSDRARIMEGVYTHPRHNSEYRIHVWGKQFVTLRPLKEFLPVAIVPADGFLDASSWERVR